MFRKVTPVARSPLGLLSTTKSLMLTLGIAAETDSVSAGDGMGRGRRVGTRGRALPVGLGCRQDPGSDTVTASSSSAPSWRMPGRLSPVSEPLVLPLAPPASSGPSPAWLEVSERAEETGTRVSESPFPLFSADMRK